MNLTLLLRRRSNVNSLNSILDTFEAHGANIELASTGEATAVMSARHQRAVHLANEAFLQVIIDTEQHIHNGK